MKYKGARIQVLDLPGIIEGAAEGKGRGRQVISTARTCNMILIILDASKPLTHKKIIEQELFSFGIRINQKPPDIKIVKKESGGIGYQENTVQTKGMNADVARVVLKEYKISCAEGKLVLYVCICGMIFRCLDRSHIVIHCCLHSYIAGGCHRGSIHRCD